MPIEHGIADADARDCGHLDRTWSWMRRYVVGRPLDDSKHPGRPPVEERIPPRSVLRVINPALRALLRSPFHRPLSTHLLLISVRGRKTGRVYSVPVGRHESDGMFLVSADGHWRHNLRGGAHVMLTVDGCERAAYAELEEDADEVAAIFRTLLHRYGRISTAVLGLRINIGRPPTVDEIKPAVAGRAIARVRLVADDAGTSTRGRRRNHASGCRS
jgi:F420H(2)-dependent quinone reductase